MSGQWKPGDVAIVRNRWGVENVAICSLAASIRGFVWKYGVSDTTDLVDDPARDARPLVVIDPEDDAEMSRLSDLFAGWSGRSVSTDGLSVKGAHVAIVRDILREFADPKPLAPTEPTGLGAVVEDADGIRWVRNNPRGVAEWSPENAAADGLKMPYSVWHNIRAVKVLSEGVTA